MRPLDLRLNMHLHIHTGNRSKAVVALAASAGGEALPRGPLRFQPHERLHSSADYRQVRRCGKRLRARHFGVNVALNGLPHHRLGLVVQKRFWGAVKRNRIKRCLREWFRLNKSLIAPPGKDIVIVAYPGAEHLTLSDTAKELNGALSVAG